MSAGPLQHQAQNLAALLPPLLLEAERVASTLRQGVHGRRRAGAGESFWQFRRYAPGDAASRIDWRQSARTDKLFVREREWEAAQSAYLWADSSGSMHYASQKDLPSKARRAQVLMLALAGLLLRGGEKVIWLGHEPLAAHGPAGLARIAAQIDLSQAGDSAPPATPMARHAHVVLCSDFLMPPALLQGLMQGYATLNLKGALLHVLDPAEEDLPFEGRLEMFGYEDEAPLLLPNAGALRSAYRARVAEHKARLEHLAASAGWFYVRHATDAPPATPLLQLFRLFAESRRDF